MQHSALHSGDGLLGPCSTPYWSCLLQGTASRFSWKVSMSLGYVLLAFMAFERDINLDIPFMC